MSKEDRDNTDNTDNKNKTIKQDTRSRLYGQALVIAKIINENCLNSDDMQLLLNITRELSAIKWIT
jgi:hypothetical protein